MDENPYKAPVEVRAAQEITEELPDRRRARRAAAIGLFLFVAFMAWRPDFGVKPRPFAGIRSIADCQSRGWNLTALCAASHHCLCIAGLAIAASGLAFDSRRITIIGALLCFVCLAIAFALDFVIDYSFWPR